MRVSEVDRAFGITFVDIEGLKFVSSMAYRKKGHLYIYLKAVDFEKRLEEVQKEIDDVFTQFLRLDTDDITLKDRHAREYRFIVL